MADSPASVFRVVAFSLSGEPGEEDRSPVGATGSATAYKFTSDGRRLILITNAHVVKGSLETYINEPSLGELLINVKVWGVSPETEADIAVIVTEDLNERIRREGVEREADGPGSIVDRLSKVVSQIKLLQPVPFPTTSLESGFDLSEVTAYGYPFNAQELVPTEGTVTSQLQDGRVVWWFTGGMNPGNSGGGAFTSDGKFVGVPYAGFLLSDAAGFMITSQEAISVADVIINAYNGRFINMEPLSVGISNPLSNGDLVTVGRTQLRIHENADPNNITIQAALLDGGPIAPLARWMRLFPPGTYRTSSGTITSRYDINVPVRFIHPGQERVELEVLRGAAFVDMNMAHFTQFPPLKELGREEPRVVISSVDPNSNNTDLGLHLGAAVVEVNGQRVYTVHELRDVIGELDESDPLLVSTTQGDLVLHTAQ